MTATDLLAEADKFVASGSKYTPVPLRPLVQGLADEVRRLLELAESLSERCHGQHEALAARADRAAAWEATDVSEAVEVATTLTVIAERDHWRAAAAEANNTLATVSGQCVRLIADKARLLALIEGCRGRCASPDVNGEG